ncbi:NAD+ synthase [Immundisolibacter sp.]|uniref:NAD+ synthase n=1 Tax=Immundisolibacter sp. TaxID=1934948 RepID=UPI003561982C
MARELVLALAQMNCLVGDISGNVDKIIELAATARREHGADLIVCPELAITGYPPEDLLLRPEFIERCEKGLERIRRAVGGIGVVVGFPHLSKGELYNTAAVLRDGETLALYHKHLLPNYSVFDEKRYFRAGNRPAVFELAGVQVGLTVCEDIWGPAPMAQAVRAGAQLVVNINASPFHFDKQSHRETVIRERIAVTPAPVVYVNMVGGQDELVFDGGSLVMDVQGRITQRAPAFEEGLYLARFRHGRSGLEPISGEVSQIDPIASVYQALVTGVRDYIGKNRFAGAIVGLSGGIDSALTLAVAADALGPQRVMAVMMPSPYTSGMSHEDAQAQAQALGVHYSTISITDTVNSIEAALAQEFRGAARDTTEENIQARVRGVLLMALSNKTGKLVLTTGNKTEMAVGYATLYGDMAGGFAVIKDVPKLLVYKLSRYRNSLSPVIPERVLTRPPTAELRDNQTDQDSLPPYDVLDAILELYVEQDRSAEDIARSTGASLKTIREVIGMVTRNEYKRRQAAPGVRISQRAFGRDRRYPITSGFKEPRAD